MKPHLTSNRFLGGLAFAVLLAVVWQVAAPRALPAPSRLARESLPSFGLFGEMPEEGYAPALAVLTRGMLATAVNYGVSLVLGTVLATLWLATTHALPLARQGNAVLAVVLRACPLFALVPLFIFKFPRSSFGVLGFATYAVFASAFIWGFSAARRMEDVSRSLLAPSRASPWRKLLVFHLPMAWWAIRPVLSWMALANWAFVLGGEFASGRGGSLGALVYSSFIFADTGKLLVLAAIYVSAGLVGLAMYRIAFRNRAPGTEAFTHTN